MCDVIRAVDTFCGKNGVMSSILVGISIITLRQYEIDTLQILENGVYRQILGGRQFTPIAILRGEAGSSMVKTRVIQAWLILVKSIMEGDNLLLKQILGKIMELRVGSWYTTLTKYLEEVGISYNDLADMDRTEIKAKVRDYDNRIWSEDLGQLTDREVYKRYKKSVGRSYGYDNRLESDLLFLARSNSLDLNDFKRHKGGITTCDLCDADREDLEHFLFVCPKLERARNRELVSRIASVGNNVDRVGKLLFCKADIEEVKKLLGALWRERQSLLIKMKKVNPPQKVKEKRKRGKPQNRIKTLSRVNRAGGVKCLRDNAKRFAVVNRGQVGLRSWNTNNQAA